MQAAPFVHQSHGTARQVAVQNFAGCDIDPAPVLAVNGMEMRRRMVIIVDGDDDTEESANLGHDAGRFGDLRAEGNGCVRHPDMASTNALAEWDYPWLIKQQLSR